MCGGGLRVINGNHLKCILQNSPFLLSISLVVERETRLVNKSGARRRQATRSHEIAREKYTIPPVPLVIFSLVPDVSDRLRAIDSL